MSATPSGDVTRLLERWSEGDVEALEALLPVVYDELHHMADRYMRRERPDHTLQTTAVVHEAYLNLLDQRRVDWQCREQFFGVVATLMRRVLLRHVERRGAAKRGGGYERSPLVDVPDWAPEDREELVSLNRALDTLAGLDPRQAKIVELRFFVGCSTAEIAEISNLSESTVKREWRLAKAWLRRRLDDPSALDAADRGLGEGPDP